MYFREVKILFDTRKVEQKCIIQPKKLLNLKQKNPSTFCLFRNEPAEKRLIYLIVDIVGQCAPTSTPCHNFVILGLRTLQLLQACYDNNESPLESSNNSKTDSPFTIVEKLFLTFKNIYFVNDKVRAGCPKLEHTTLVNDSKSINKFYGQLPRHILSKGTFQKVQQEQYTAQNFIAFDLQERVSQFFFLFFISHYVIFHSLPPYQQFFGSGGIFMIPSPIYYTLYCRINPVHYTVNNIYGYLYSSLLNISFREQGSVP